MDLKTLEAQAIAYRDQSARFLAEVRVRMHDRRSINDEELRDYAARFPLIQIDPVESARASENAYVIKHPTFGVYLGKPADAIDATDPAFDFWSYGDRGGRIVAETRHTLADAQALVDQLNALGPDEYVVAPVKLAAGHGDASMADCVRAGLPAWTIDGRPCTWEFKDPAGAYHTAEGCSLREALRSVQRSQEMFTPTRVYPAESMIVVNCAPLTDDALNSLIQREALQITRRAEQAALQAHNGPLVKAYLDAGGDEYTEQDEVADSMGRPS